MNSAVQSGLDLTAIEADTALIGAAERSHAIAVLDVVGSEGALASADDATQAELLAGRAQFLNAQISAFQILVRAEPVDLEGHLRRVRSRAESLAEPLASIARDYVSFVQALAHQRMLLERHCYVVVPDRTEIPATTLRRRIGRVFSRTPDAAEREGSGIPADVARRLAARCDQTARQLGRAGLRTQRLTSQQLGELFHRCWCPELARVQRLREELGAYTTMAVNGHRGSPDQVVLSGAAGRAEDDASRSEDERLFRLGTRSIVDLIAPSAYEVRRDHVRLDGHYARVLAVTAYPRLVTPGWLGLLVESDLPIELSVHLGMHFLSDVLAGAAIGTALAFASTHLLRTI